MLNSSHTGAIAAVGNTPLIRLNKLSEHTGCEILAKAEFLNPGGSVKDRIARAIILEAEAQGRLKPGGVVVEGTAGNTGIGLTMLANARGYRTIITIPDNQTQEKIDFLRLLGAEVHAVPVVPFANQQHFCHQARRLAEGLPNAIFADQFNNLANRRAHYETTGPEIWAQTGGKVDALVAAAGTGGTISGAGLFLKERNPAVRVVLADPLGSALYSYVKTGELDSDGDSMAEGIGIGRLVPNFEGAPVDDALQVDDRALVATAYHLVREEGLLLGTSAAVNVWAAARTALAMGPGHTIVTFLCDGGQRYLSRLYNPVWLAEQGHSAASTGFGFLTD
ncbi:MAG: cysK, cysteine synthase [Cyanobacteria bacterium RYN_339]|nr:cysK, cysteine synthase [Cyanobacteria bacterium RYN_339]